MFKKVKNRWIKIRKAMSSVDVIRRLRPKPAKKTPTQFINFQRNVTKWILANSRLLTIAAEAISMAPARRLGKINRKASSSAVEINNR